MSTTFAGRLAMGEHRDMKLAVVIQGIPYAFTEDPDTVAAGITDRTNVKVLEKIEVGETRLNMWARREVGGSLTITLMDDADQTLRNIFRPRSRRSTWLAQNLEVGEYTMLVGSVTGLTSPLYVDGETFSWSSTFGTQILLDLTRGLYGTEQRFHAGGTTNGASVYQYPPSWVGRRVSLLGYFSSTAADVLGTWRVESAPRYLGNDRWEISCGSVADEIAKLKVGVGIAPAEFDPPYRDPNGDLAFALSQASMRYAFPNSSIASYWVRVESPGGLRFLAQVGLVAGGTVTVIKDTIGGYYGHKVDKEVEAQPGDLWTLTPVFILTGYAVAVMLLQILTSRLGDSTNGSYDNLPGSQRTEWGGPELRAGAGMLSTDIDTDSITDHAQYGIPWTYIIDGEQSLGDVLADFCLATNTVWYIDVSGRLAFRSVATTSNEAGTTIDDDVLIEEPTVEWLEDETYPRLTVRCNYSPVTGDYETTLNVVDVELQERSRGREESVEIESRSIRITEHGQPDTVARGFALPGIERDAVRDMLRRIQTGNGRGRLMVHTRCTGQLWATSAIGQRVTIGVSSAPDFAGGNTSSLSGIVVGRKPNYDDGTVDLEIEAQDKLYVIAPCMAVTAISVGPPYVLTLSGTLTGTGDMDDGVNQFAVGDTVYVWDMSGNTFASRTVTASAWTSVTLSSAPGFAVAVGDLVFHPIQTGATSTYTNAAGYTRIDFLYQMPDNENGSGVDFVTRWR